MAAKTTSGFDLIFWLFAPSFLSESAFFLSICWH